MVDFKSFSGGKEACQGYRRRISDLRIGQGHPGAYPLQAKPVTKNEEWVVYRDDEPGTKGKGQGLRRRTRGRGEGRKRKGGRGPQR